MRAAPWNVVVTVSDQGFKDAFRVLAPFGRVHRTHYYNILTMTVPDVAEFLEAVRRRMEEDPEKLSLS